MAKKSLLDTIKSPNTAEELDKIAAQIHGGGSPAGKSTKTPTLPQEDLNEQHRLTIDLPRWLVATIKAEGKQNGQTIRGVILSVLLERFKE
jgi:hypothetical protein